MRPDRGFSLIELLMTLALLGALLLLALPAYSLYMTNVRIRSVAQSFHAGLLLARAEAVKRNASVDFLMTDTDVTGGVDFATAEATPSGTRFTGNHWLIRTTDLANFIEAKSGAEGGRSGVDLTGSLGMVTFSSLGGAAAADFRFESPAAGNCIAAGGQVRCLEIRVSPGGQVRLCDPSVTAAGDTRGCG